MLVLDVSYKRMFLETTKPRVQRVLSGRWTPCNANPAGSHHHKLAALKIIIVFCKHGIEFDRSWFGVLLLEAERK
jgi:hypothetical protein